MRRTVLLGLLLVLVWGPLAHAKPPENADIRVLIDISGSMKQNDPNNLRRPAVRMLVGLMQPGTQAGVWTFARWVNNLVPVGPVDPAWKQKVIKLSEKINSPGQRTNIEDVLERATRSWKGKPPQFRRNLVLLTDGVVDIDKDAVKNAASRQRIFDQLLPRMRDDQVKVHAIALSENADHALLKKLAEDTGGQYQRVDDAEQLQRVFLRIFENAGKPDAVPLAGNKFTVDRSISEATVLVFRDKNAKQTVLHAPDGQSFEGSDLPNGIAWQSDQGYDMITIADPQAGEWRLEADVDPDNRVMIVTDLKLEVSELPNRLVIGEQVPLAAHLSNKGKVIRKPAFLNQVNFTASSPLPGGSFDYQLNDKGRSGDEQAADGRYSTRVGLDEAQPDVEILVAAENPTFMREFRHHLSVVEPMAVTIAGDGPTAVVEVQIDDGVMQPDATLAIWQTGPDGSRIDLTAEANGKRLWRAPISDPGLPVHVQLEGSTRAGHLVQRVLGPVYMPGVTPKPKAIPLPVVLPVAVPEPQSQPEPQVAAEPPPQAEPVAEPAAEPVVEEEEESWVMPAIILGGSNLLLVLGGLAFWLIRRRSGGDDDIVLVDEDGDDVEDAEVSPA